MKTIEIKVHIQMDIRNVGDPLKQVQDALEQMNVLTQKMEQQPQIFISDLNSSDIIDVSTEGE